MANLQIDTAKFKAACEDARYHYENRKDVSGQFTYRHWLSIQVETDEIRSTAKVQASKAAPTFEDFRAELSTAARAAYLDGASQKQVEYLASLAAKAGETQLLAFNRLTKAEAFRMINDYLKG